MRGMPSSLHNLAMDFSITVHHGPPLLIVASGEAQVYDVMAVCDLTARIAREASCHRAVLDLRGVQQGFSFTDHMRIGMHAADALCDLERVASVVDARQKVGIGERSAQKAGLMLQAFTELDAALTWIKEAN